MSDSENAKKVLCEYYEAILEDDLDKLPLLCDDPFTVISLYGTATASTAPELIKMYAGIMDNFENQGMSRKLGYDKNNFKVIDIQANVKLIQAVLTKFDSKQQQAGTWNCTYVLVNKNKKWVISLATSDNEQTTTIK